MFGTLSSRFSWRPNDIAKLTMPQLRAYMDYLSKNPVAQVTMVDIKGDGE